jgi:hypothetical protein
VKPIHSYFNNIITPAPRGVWEDLVQHDLLAMIFQTPIWTDAITALSEYEDVSRLYETRDGRLLVLPLIRHRAVHAGLTVSASMPDGWGMGGIVSAQPVCSEDAANILAEINSQPHLHTSLRPNPLTADIWDREDYANFQRVPRETHIIKLDGGFETIWSKRFSSATRTKIRKAEKEGVEVVVGKGGDLLDTFYDVYIQWLDQRADERGLPHSVERWLGKRREPLRKFRAAAQALGSDFQVWVALVQGQPAAAALLLFGQQQAVYWRSASVKQVAGSTRANDLLQSRMIAEACAAGCRYYHMGESGGVESLKHFKSRFGAEPHAFYSFHHKRVLLSRAENMVEKLTRQIEQRLVKEV